MTLHAPGSPFAAFAPSVTPQTPLRAAVTAAYRRPEPDCVAALLGPATLPPREAAEAARQERDAALGALRTEVDALAARLGELTDVAHRDEVARAQQLARLEQLQARAVDELGVDPAVLMEEFGPHRRTSLRFGGQKINLRPADATQTEWWSGTAAAPATQDLCFIVTVAALEIVAHLHRCGVTVELGPVTKDGALGPINSVYCRDPDGNLIEISSYSD